MNDRELLEMAAKAAGLDQIAPAKRGGIFYGGGKHWNPLTDDREALRLAVDLRLDICRPLDSHEAVCVWADHLGDFIEEPHGDDPYSATRRAIVRAAAEIGKAMP